MALSVSGKPNLKSIREDCVHHVDAIRMLADACCCEFIPNIMFESDDAPILQFTCKDNTEAGTIKRFLLETGLYYNAYPHKDYKDRGTYFAVWAKPWPKSTPR